MTSLPWKTNQQSSGYWTAHSMKSTLLSWGTQMVASGQVSPEDVCYKDTTGRVPSAALERTSAMMCTFQKKLIEHVRRGGRFTTSQHRGAQHPMHEPPVQMDFFRKDLIADEWQSFTFASNAEQMAVSECLRLEHLTWRIFRLPATWNQHRPQILTPRCNQ